MGLFYDVYLPSSVPGYPCLSSPVFSTTITEAAGGDEGRNRNWRHPKRKFKLPAAQAREWNVIQDLINHALVMGGPEAAFPFRDPLDFATIGLAVPNERDAAITPRLGATDQNFGTGDGTTRSFTLAKTYTRGPYTYQRAIELPVVGTMKVAVHGTPTTAYAVTRPGGVVTFDVAPPNGHAITWGGLFDVPVRFDQDTAIDAIIQAYQAGGFAEINLDEVRVC